MSQKIFNILTYLQICLFWFLTLGHYWVFLQEEKKYFRTCETFQILIWIMWMK